MDSSFFFLQIPKNPKNSRFIDRLAEISINAKKQIYIINKPLGDSRYDYEYKEAAVVLMPKHKILGAYIPKSHRKLK